MKGKIIKVGITVGDLNGIGGEIILKSFEDKKVLNDFDVVIYASNEVMTYYKDSNNLDVNLTNIKNEEDIIKGKVNVINIWEEKVNIEYGVPTKKSGEYSLKSLEAGTDALKKGKIDCLVTAPIDKNNINKSGFNFSGHTEYLENRIGGNSIMIMTYKKFRLGLVTNHTPIENLKNEITKELIENKLSVLNKSLKDDFCIKHPKIAVLGLNPHSGDNGLLGNEEKEIIVPTIKKVLKEYKIRAYGPFSADGFFSSGSYKKYDAVLAMYHDQGLIPFKIISKNKGVNFTGGICKVRTSPAHGTAFDLAGKNKAEYKSFLEALYTSVSIYKKRNNG